MRTTCTLFITVETKNKLYFVKDSDRLLVAFRQDRFVCSYFVERISSIAEGQGLIAIDAHRHMQSLTVVLQVQDRWTVVDDICIILGTYV
jgi:hypothetical protein